MNKPRKMFFVFLMLSLVLLGGYAGDSSELPAGDTPETETAGISPDQIGRATSRERV